MTASEGSLRPACPFCHAEWTDRMLALLDSYQAPGGCSCCADMDEPAHDYPFTVPSEDLCCAACGKAIYTAPRLLY